MDKILVTYATNSGSTVEVANTVKDAIQQTGATVQILPLSEVHELESYSAVILGAPMILGWHRNALRFLRKHHLALSRIPLAVFVTCMSLTDTTVTSYQGVPVIVDEKLPQPRKVAGRLTLKERYSLVSNYLRPILRACPVKPVSVGIFAGQLNFSRMQWWAMLFVVLFLQTKPGDRRNWDAIRLWAQSLPVLLTASNSKELSSENDHSEM